MPLTDAQRNALSSVRAMYASMTIPFGTSASVEERARQPDPGSLPADVTLRVEIAPAPAHPHPLLPIDALKTPERVPIYFFALRGDPVEAEAETGTEAGPEEVADTRVLFYIHGGGNIFGHPTNPPFIHFYVQLLRAIAKHSQDARKCVLVAPTYRLATIPENAFPAALQDLVVTYDHVLGKGYKASNIVIGGDSAGGNHALVLTHLVLQSDRPAPRGVIAIAPHQAYDHASEHAKAQTSQDIIPPAFSVMTIAYLGDSGAAHTDPLISGTFIPFMSSWPETLIIVGTADGEVGVSRELEKRLRARNRPVELVEYDECPHGWWALAHIFSDDIQDAAQRIARFVLGLTSG